MTGIEIRPTAERIAATILAALDRAEDRGSVVCLAGRALDALAELHGLAPEAIAQATPLSMRPLDFERQARRLGWDRQRGE